ncbi:MAG: hypothetical protein R2864_15355 [Syntrophotaleaceae bacterium]
MVGLKMNVPHGLIDKVIALLPSLNRPTVAHLYQSDLGFGGDGVAQKTGTGHRAGADKRPVPKGLLNIR